MSGPVGVGKSTLLQKFDQRARDAGALVLSATVSQAEKRLPFEVMTQLLQDVALRPDCQELIQQQIDIEFCSVVLTGKPGEEDRERAYGQIVRTVWLLLERLSDERPVVITIDDVQHADGMSARALVSLARRLRHSRVLMVFSERGLPRRHGSAFRAELLRLPHARRIRLSLLDLEGVRRQLADEIGEEAAERLAADCHAATGGNPLLVRAMAEDHRNSLGPPPRTSPREAFEDAVLSCLFCGDAGVLDTAHVIAVLGDKSSVELVSAMLDRDRRTVMEYLQVLQEAGLVEGTRFRDATAERAVLHHIAAPERARLNLRIATLLRRSGAPAGEVVGHLLEAGSPLPWWAPGLLSEEAEAALVRARTEYAVRCLKLAHAVTGEEDRGAVAALLAAAEWRTDPTVPLRHAPAMAAALRQGRLDWRDGVFLLRMLLWHGRLGEAEAVLDLLGALPEHRAATPDEERFLHIWLSCFYPSLAKAPAQRDDQPAPTGAPGQFDPYRSAADILDAVVSGRVEESAVSRAEHLLRNCLLTDSTLELLRAALTALIEGKRLRGAARHCDALLARAARHRATTWQAVLYSLRAEIALRDGDPHRAGEQARAALARVPAEKWGVAVGAPLSALLRAATDAGDAEEADRVLSTPVPEALYETRYGLDYRQARGYHLAVLGRREEAADDFESCRDLLSAWGLDARTGPFPRLDPPGLAVVPSVGAPPGSVVPPRPEPAPATGRPWVVPRQPTAKSIPATPAWLLGGDAAPVRLSKSERRVAELAAHGHTNREISKKLYVTVSTVEQHLTSTYRKLGVRRRTELAARLAALEALRA